MPVGRCLGADIVDLGLDALDTVAIGEVPVGDPRGHVARGPRAPALEDFRVRVLQRLGLEGVVVETVEIAVEAEIVLRPDALQGTNELLGSAIALIMVQPWLADGAKLALEPAGHHVDGDAARGELVDACQLLGCQYRRPGSGQDRGDHLEFFGGGQQRVADGYRLVLVVSAIAGGEADLRKRVLEPGTLGNLRQLAVVIDVPAGALFDLADNEATADVRNPVGEFDRLAHGDVSCNSESQAARATGI